MCYTVLVTRVRINIISLQSIQELRIQIPNLYHKESLGEGEMGIDPNADCHH